MYNLLELLYVVQSCPLTKTTVTTTTMNFVLINIIFIMLFCKGGSNNSGIKQIPYLIYRWFHDNMINILPMKKQKLLNFFFCIFILVFMLNLTGLIPLSETVTGYFYINLYISLTLQLGIIITGIYYHNFSYVTLFLPDKIPAIIALLLVPIEIVSFISRIFSLALRLFANMFAGHIVLKIICCFS